jgi:hypothetical protein
MPLHKPASQTSLGGQLPQLPPQPSSPHWQPLQCGTQPPSWRRIGRTDRTGQRCRADHMFRNAAHPSPDRRRRACGVRAGSASIRRCSVSYNDDALLSSTNGPSEPALPGRPRRRTWIAGCQGPRAPDEWQRTEEHPCALLLRVVGSWRRERVDATSIWRLGERVNTPAAAPARRVAEETGRDYASPTSAAERRRNPVRQAPRTMIASACLRGARMFAFAAEQLNPGDGAAAVIPRTERSARRRRRGRDRTTSASRRLGL